MAPVSQGRTQTEALTAIFNVQKLYVYDPVPAAAAKFKEDMKDYVQGEIIVVDHPQKAAKADAVITVTPATQAFLKGGVAGEGHRLFCHGFLPGM